jgi:Flp pilus assembly protein TadD
VVIARPTGPVPPDTSLSAWLEGALALERIGRLADATAAYETATAHWPDAPAPRLAFANLLAGQGDLAGAEAALRTARQSSPNDAIVLNNLADVQLQQGKCEQARATASAAVAAGGKYQDVARQTLDAAQTCQPKG